MKTSTKISFGILCLAFVIALLAFKTVKKDKQSTQQKIQVAILLDVSGSMDGLIDQAKSQLWNMVNTFGKAKCGNDLPPKIEIALYEYGRTTNDAKLGYVKQINSFISDLDSLSGNLFKLTTNGGDEYCGHVIYSSLQELNWDAAPDNYKVIFICGNEDFLQGDVHYSVACAEAKKKGVVVNTIYCGDKQQGINEHWNLNTECGNGSFSNINQNAKVEDIPTPFDSTIIAYNEKLNGTYLAFGSEGYYRANNQNLQDVVVRGLSTSTAIKRTKAKANKATYNNAQWDLVDAKEKNGDGVIDKLDRKTLPDSLKNKTTDELKQLINAKATERANIQKEIVVLNTKRDDFIATEKAKNTTLKNNTQTLETEVEKIIKTQAKRYNIVIE